jgi:hypothetical protein
MALIWEHLVLLVHFEDASVVDDFLDEGPIEVEAVDVVVSERIHKGQFLVHLLPHSTEVTVDSIIPRASSNLLALHQNRQHVTRSSKVVARSIHIHVLEQLTQDGGWLHTFLHLDLQLCNLVGLSFELAIQQEKISKSFGEVAVALFYLV